MLRDGASRAAATAECRAAGCTDLLRLPAAPPARRSARADSHFANGHDGPNWESRVAVREPGQSLLSPAQPVSDPGHSGLWPAVTVSPKGIVLVARARNDDGSGGGQIAAAARPAG